MKVLLIGANGQVGHEILCLAPELGVTIDPSDRGRLDLSVPGQAAALISANAYDGVLNAAAYTAVDAAEDDAEAAERVNAQAPGEIAAACKAKGIPLVHYSTDYVFDGTGMRPLVETDPTGPLGVYGCTKLAGEEAVRISGCDHVIIRLAWVFSAHGRNFVKTMLRLGAERGALSIVADQFGTPTPAADAAHAGLVALAAVKRNPTLVGTYHFAGAEGTSWAEFAGVIFQEAAMDVAVTPIGTEAYPTRAKRPAYSVLDSSKFAEAFGIPAANWRSGLKGVIGTC
ncbi:MAG: dTDP-4-dehydrorhamnose reductase [Pseudomonadota bacterium]